MFDPMQLPGVVERRKVAAHLSPSRQDTVCRSPRHILYVDLKSLSTSVTPAIEVVISSAFVYLGPTVSLLARLRKYTQPIFTKFSGKVHNHNAHEPRKKRLDFNGNPDRVTLGYEL